MVASALRLKGDTFMLVGKQLGGEPQANWKARIKKHGGRVLDNWSAKVTHVVYEGSPTCCKMTTGANHSKDVERLTPYQLELLCEGKDASLQRASNGMLLCPGECKHTATLQWTSEVEEGTALDVEDDKYKRGSWLCDCCGAHLLRVKSGHSMATARARPLI